MLLWNWCLTRVLKAQPDEAPSEVFLEPGIDLGLRILPRLIPAAFLFLKFDLGCQ